MRTGETVNARKFAVVSLEALDGEIESMPAAPFGALVVMASEPPLLKAYSALVARLLKAGCAFATLHAGKRTSKLHEIFDKAVVDYQLKHDRDADLQTSGEAEDSLEEAIREAVHFAKPYYGDPFAELLILVIGKDDDKLAEQAEALAKSVKAE
jgi:hypothetical protein